MPLYTFRCDGSPSHTFDHKGRMDFADSPVRCPVLLDPANTHSRCDAAVHPIIAAPASVFPGADSWRRK